MATLAGGLAGGLASAPVRKISTRLARTKYGLLRGVILQQQPVEAFLGVPYATAPLGSLRYMPPVTPSMWKTPRLCDSFSPVCPQRAPSIGNRTEALLEFPRGRLVYLEKLLPLLANQSEDCLYMNIYVPQEGESKRERRRGNTVGGLRGTSAGVIRPSVHREPRQTVLDELLRR
ncbi:hypothetical protein ONE63_004287 [Megalurothrips usitatus]|uniref:Carboxylesterase type B domain-containing protein n=1 Tax=Megalurothrips usitatus TaxID=439358 RepID=A0AAV7X2C9_9NEOP|nr:hypothetical protein ONE63_004287 [Megalurothrips usitatus]